MPAPGLNDDACLVASYVDLAAETVVQSSIHLALEQMMTLRTQVLVAGAVWGADGRKRVLRLGLRGPWRERFAALLKRLSELTRSTVAQFIPD
jgi:hypothetical protein